MEAAALSIRLLLFCALVIAQVREEEREDVTSTAPPDAR